MTRTKFPASCVATLLMTSALTAAPTLAQNVFDDFSSGNDNAWNRVDAPGLFLGIPSTYSVEGGGYRLRGPTYPNVGLTLPTASLRFDGAASDSQITVDVTDWSDSSRQAVSIVGRLQTPTAQTFQFYALTFFPGSISNPNLAGIRLDRWNADQSVTNLTSIALFSIPDLTHTFRMRFTLEGAQLSGEIFNLTLDPSVAVQTVSTFDSAAGAVSGIGVPGIMTYPNPADINAPTFGPADVTFDNFRVVPAPGTAAMLTMAGLLAGRRRR